MATVISRLGYRVTDVPHRNYSGMEIDIEAVAEVAATTLYAECKCYSEPITAPMYQTFFAKYMARRLKDSRCHGLFIALPSANGSAWAFHRDSVVSADLPVEIIEQDRVAELVVKASLAVPETVPESAVTPEQGTPGDRHLLITDRGAFWAQYVIRPGAVTPTALLLLDGGGRPVADSSFLDQLAALSPELAGFDWLVGAGPNQTSHPPTEAMEEVVEVKASSAYFEYQFPASPEYFVGRRDAFARLETFTEDVLNRTTSARSMLIEASSGWGKSSFLLASVQRLREGGHHALSIDSRSASSSQFVLQLVASIAEMPGLSKHLPDEVRDTAVSGFTGALKQLAAIDEVLQERRELLMIFLDQFENVFFLPAVLGPIYNLFSRVLDRSGNIVMAFAWKTDLVAVMDDFPFTQREAIRSGSRVISLPRFGERETNQVLDSLRVEMKVASLREDLRFLLSEFSQGYPWLLMKLCSHVRDQKRAGAKQADIATSVLNVEELFAEDLRGLTAQEDDVLHAIARSAPLAVADMGEEFEPDLVQRLVHKRLVVRIGSKYDIYWDIFRDYLNTGRLPIQEHYILRVSPRSVLSRVRSLVELGGEVSIADFAVAEGVSERSLNNVVREMRVLGFVAVTEGRLQLTAPLALGNGFNGSVHEFLKDRLPRNHVVQGVLRCLGDREKLTVEECADVLSEHASYVSATPVTWQQYARILGDWLDLADLAVFDGSQGYLRRFIAGTEVRERNVFPARRRSELTVPRVQYTPVISAAKRLVAAANSQRSPDWNGFTPSTLRKALGDLSDLGFLRRQGASLILDQALLELCGEGPEEQARLFGQYAMELESFSAFVGILRETTSSPLGNRELGQELRKRLGLRWKDGTADTNAKIMLDWARHAGLAPSSYELSHRGRRHAGQSSLQV